MHLGSHTTAIFPLRFDKRPESPLFVGLLVTLKVSNIYDVFYMLPVSLAFSFLYLCLDVLVM